jgi:cell division cycle 20, cofactor of APC complex
VLESNLPLSFYRFVISLLCLSCSFVALTMDAGSRSISSAKNRAAAVAAAPRPPLQEAGSRPYMPSLSSGPRNPSAKCYVSPLVLVLERVGCSTFCLTKLGSFSPPPSHVCVLQGDRFIPDRSAMDMDLAHYLLTEPRRDKENASGMAASPSKEAYRRLLAEKLLNNRTRILAFRSKPPEPENVSFADTTSSNLQAKPAKQRRHIPQVCATALLFSHLAISSQRV